MFYAVAPPLNGSSSGSKPTTVSGFVTGTHFANHFTSAKGGLLTSPVTDSFVDDLSSSCGGVMQESVPLSTSAPAPMTIPGVASTSTLASHTGVGTPLVLTRGGAQASHGNRDGRPFFGFGYSPENTASDGGDQHPFIDHALGSHTFVDSESDGSDDGGDDAAATYDFAGLESLVKAAVGDDSDAPSPTRRDHGPVVAAGPATENKAATLPAVAVAPSAPKPQHHLSTPPSASPAKSSTGSIPSGPPSTSSVSVAGRGGVGLGGSPSAYSASFAPEVVAGALPPQQILPVMVDQQTVPVLVATTAASTPLVGAEMSVPYAVSMMNASGSVSNTATSQPSDAEVRSNLFICGLPITVTDKELTAMFGKFGVIESAKVMLDIHTGRSRGIAFVKFKRVEDAENAVDALNGSMLDGQPITVRVANSRAAYLPGNPTNKTFVRNVPLSVSRSTLMEYFSQFGEVTDLSIKSDTAQGRHHATADASVMAAPVALAADDAAEEKLNIVFITYAEKEAAARAAEATHTKAPFKECNGVPLLAKVAEDTTRRMERLSRRVQSRTGLDSKDGSSSIIGSGSNSLHAAYPLGYAAPQMGVSPPSVMSLSAAGGGYGAPTYVAMPGMAAGELSALSMMPPPMSISPPQQPQQMALMRDATGALVYATAFPAQAGMPYAVAQQQQQQQPQQSAYTPYFSGATQGPPPQFSAAVQPTGVQLPGMPGQIVYVPTANGSLMPMVYGGAQPQAPMASPYYMMMNNQ